MSNTKENLFSNVNFSLFTNRDHKSKMLSHLSVWRYFQCLIVELWKYYISSIFPYFGLPITTTKNGFFKNIFFLPWAISCVCYHWKEKKITNLIGRLFLYVLLPIQNRTHVFNLKKSRVKTRDNTVYGAVQLGILARYLSVLDSWFNIFIPKFTLKSTLHLIISWRHISWLKDSSWVCLLASFVKSQTLQPIKTIALLNAKFPSGVYFWTRTFS